MEVGIACHDEDPRATTSIGIPRLETRDFTHRRIFAFSSGLVGLAVLLDLAGNRWASYLVTPFPGLYLPDFLLLAGVGLALAFGWRHVRIRRWVWISYGSVFAYIGLVLAPELLFIPKEDLYLAIRDAAPFLYLALVPAIAISLRGVRARTAVVLVRMATIASAMGTLLVRVGALDPVPSMLMGSVHVQLLEYRTDLTGVAIAIGIVAWSAWPRENLKPAISIQVLLVATAGLAIGSRTGLVVVALAVVWVAFRQLRPIWRLPAVTVSAIILLSGIWIGYGLFGASDLEWSGQSGVSTETEIELPPQFTRVGTIEARLDTWSKVIEGLGTDFTWPLGGSAGSDYLYELCTGLKQAPDVVTGQPGELKCMVDDEGPHPVLRDPHNWILNLGVTHGILGLAVYVGVVATTLVKSKETRIFSLAAWMLGFFLVAGLTFVISGGYALLPIAVALGWLTRNSGIVFTGQMEPDLENAGTEHRLI